MREIRLAATAALVMAIVATPVFAAMQEKTPVAKTHVITGEVVSVDTATGTLVVRQTLRNRPAVEVTFRASPTTRIVMGKEKMDLSTLAAGERVRVTYRGADGFQVATRIAIVKQAAGLRPAASSR